VKSPTDTITLWTSGLSLAVVNVLDSEVQLVFVMLFRWHGVLRQATTSTLTEIEEAALNLVIQRTQIENGMEVLDS